MYSRTNSVNLHADGIVNSVAAVSFQGYFEKEVAVNRREVSSDGEDCCYDSYVITKANEAGNLFQKDGFYAN